MTIPRKWHRNGIKKPWSQRYKSLKGRRPQVPEELVLCQEAQQEGPEEDASPQHQDHECPCQGCPSPHQAQGGQAPDLKGWQPQARLAYIAHHKLGKRAHAHIAKRLGLCRPKSKAKAQPKAQEAAVAQAPKGAQAPRKFPSIESLSANVRMQGLV